MVSARAGYEGAGHGFMRAGETPPPPADADQKVRDAYAGNKKARDEAWTRWKALLKKFPGTAGVSPALGCNYRQTTLSAV